MVFVSTMSDEGKLICSVLDLRRPPVERACLTKCLTPALLLLLLESIASPITRFALRLMKLKKENESLATNPKGSVQAVEGGE